jgi:hypothetical protein
MKKLILAVIMAFPVTGLLAQENSGKTKVEPSGLFFGVGIGAGTLSLSLRDTTRLSFASTLPNVKLGYRFNQRWALLTLLPGANYSYQGKDRGFEGIMVSGQYWLKTNWWLMAATGMTFDAPAFYTVKDPKTAGFYIGFPAVSLATGYEIWHKGKWTMDLQYRFFYGKSNLPDNRYREGISNMFIAGFNWY